MSQIWYNTNFLSLKKSLFGFRKLIHRLYPLFLRHLLLLIIFHRGDSEWFSLIFGHWTIFSISLILLTMRPLIVFFLLKFSTFLNTCLIHVLNQTRRKHGTGFLQKLFINTNFRYFWQRFSGFDLFANSQLFQKAGFGRFYFLRLCILIYNNFIALVPFFWRVCNLRSLNIESLEVISVGFEVLYLSIYESRKLRIKGWRLDMEDPVVRFLLGIRRHTLKGKLPNVIFFIFLLNKF